MTSAQKKFTTPILIIVGMVAWAILPKNPYVYYLLLRLVCCPLLVILFFFKISMIKDKRPVKYPIDLIGWPGIFALLVILYNPVVQVHLTREVWTFINIGTILLLGGFWFLNIRKIEEDVVFSNKQNEPISPQKKVPEIEEANKIFEEAKKLFDVEKFGDSIKLLDQLIQKYDQKNDLEFTKLVARSRFCRALNNSKLSRKEEAIKGYLYFIEKYQNWENDAISDLVKMAREQISRIQPSN